ncbi:MAG: anthranilate phosphoribosyltransferase [Gemmatimonadaceae bacterium]|nr:anthranilate phosphoribosyltransferase [Gemmatimonadaceae bacterium]
MSGAAPRDPLQGAIRTLAMGGHLDEDACAAAFDVVMAGDATPVQVAALLMALRVKGETPGEVAGAARALRRAMTVLEAPDPDALVDTCGTGGGTLTTFNISTAAALVAAGHGVRIAKHGNRSFTSQCGSADVLEALGVAIEVPVPAMAATLARAGIVFMFAPLMHPAMKHVGPVRRELGVPSVMNIVGPLANPARAGRQVIGVADVSRMPLIAGALAALDTAHALVVHGAPGLDEISPLGATRVLEVRRGTAPREWTIEPAAFGYGDVSADELRGGDPAVNAALVHALFAGSAPRGAAAAVVLNAAAALYVAGAASTYADAVAMLQVPGALARGADALARLATR